MSKGPIYLPVHQHAAATTGVVDPVCGMTVDPGQCGRARRVSRAYLLLLLPALRRKVQGESGAVPCSGAGRPRHATRGSRRRIHVSDAPGSAWPQGARVVPSSAGWPSSRASVSLEAEAVRIHELGGHDAALEKRRHPHGTHPGAHGRRNDSGAVERDAANGPELDPARPCITGCAVGRLASLPAARMLRAVSSPAGASTLTSSVPPCPITDG